MTTESSTPERVLPSGDALFEVRKPVELEPVEQFVVKEHFISSTTTKDVGIGWVSDNFDVDFRDKVESPIRRKTVLSVLILRRAANSMEIIRAVRKYRVQRCIESEIRDTSLGQMWMLLKRQGKGQPGRLPLDGTPVIAFSSNKGGVPKTVEFYWQRAAAGWGCGAYSTQQSPHEFPVGTTVISSFRTE